MYTTENFKTKKALREAIKVGKQVRVYQPGLGPEPTEGTIVLEGPHYPAPHSWYAEGTLKNGVLVKVS